LRKRLFASQKSDECGLMLSTAEKTAASVFTKTAFFQSLLRPLRVCLVSRVEHPVEPNLMALCPGKSPPSSQDWTVRSHSSHSHSFQQCPVRYRRRTWKPCTLHAHLKSLQKSGCQAYPSLWLWVQLGFETLHLLLSFLGG
jgi:hypothetical protein